MGTSVETLTSKQKKSQLVAAKVETAKEERANSSKKEREVMTSQSLAVNSKVNSTSTLKVSSTLISVTSTVNSVETANQNAQNSTVNSTSTLMMTNSVENLTSIWKTS